MYVWGGGRAGQKRERGRRASGSEVRAGMGRERETWERRGRAGRGTRRGSKPGERGGCGPPQVGPPGAVEPGERGPVDGGLGGLSAPPTRAPPRRNRQGDARERAKPAGSFCAVTERAVGRGCGRAKWGGLSGTERRPRHGPAAVERCEAKQRPEEPEQRGEARRPEGTRPWEGELGTRRAARPCPGLRLSRSSVPPSPRPRR